MRFLFSRFGLVCVLWMSMFLNLLSGITLWKSLYLTHRSVSQLNAGSPNLINIDHSKSPLIHIITATYSRLVQYAELTRMCHTLMHVRNINWIVVEDAETPSKELRLFLEQCGVSFTHLNAKTPPELILPPGQPRWKYPRGVVQRNRGLQWLRENLKRGKDMGFVYIADDDNTYSLRLFDEIRSTRRVSTWPVALVGRLVWEGCVTRPGRPEVIERMQTVFKPWREFPIDMAAFAVNLDLVLAHPEANFVAIPKLAGMLETNFLKSLGLRNFTDLEPKADGCKRILVWHTQSKEPDLIALDKTKTGIQTALLPTEV